MVMRFLLYILAIVTILSPNVILAQTLPGVSDPVTMVVSPNSPRPNERVTITLQSFSVDLNTATITWFVDGKRVSGGVGETSFVTRSGALGTTRKIDVSVRSGSFSFDESVTLRPGNLNLLWESDTYTPPFYRGKALHSYNGSFRVIAIPEIIGSNGRLIEAKDLVYTWRKNGSVVASASGYGKNSFVSSQTSYLRTGEEIGVEVSTTDGEVTVSRYVTIEPTVPKVVFYEASDFYGVRYGRALGDNFEMNGDELTVLAEPYFFSIPNRGHVSVSSTWKLNGAELLDFSNESAVTLRRDGESSGRSELELVIQHRNKVLQGGRGSLSITFDENN